MRSYNRSSVRFIIIAAGLTIILAGCSKKITVSQYPAFYTPDLKNIVVVPFRNATQNPTAGAAFSENVTRALMANSTYHVASQTDVAALENQNDLMIMYSKGADEATVASRFRPFGKCQALVVGTVTTYSATQDRQNRQEPQYTYDRYGNPVIIGYRKYVMIHNEGNVVVSAALIRISDGSIIHATSTPLQGKVSSEGSPASKDPYACLAQASSQVVSQLVDELCVVQKQITVYPDRDFKTAKGCYDNKWDCSDRFKPGEKCFLVVRLPASCDRNRFRITIVKKDCREDLASQDVVWSRNFEDIGHGFEFDTARLFKLGGPGYYTAKFYSGPEPVMMRDFKIEQ